MSKRKSDAPAGTPEVPDEAPERTDSDAPAPNPSLKPDKATDE